MIIKIVVHWTRETQQVMASIGERFCYLTNVIQLPQQCPDILGSYVYLIPRDRFKGTCLSLSSITCWITGTLVFGT